MRRETLRIVPSLCTGCLSCELACSFGHEGEFNPLASRIRVALRNEVCLGAPSACIQCVESPCIGVCPTGALIRDVETGAILLDAVRCTDCCLCVAVCPHGGIHSRTHGSTPIICDLCGGAPRCVRVCAPGALRYVAPEEE